MRDCVFFTADSTMKQALLGFMTRNDRFAHYNLGTAPFAFDPNEDLFSSATMDPGTYTTGEELMRPFQKTHRHAVLMLDAQWDGSPGAAAIRTDLSNRILVTGWPADAFKVIVIEPQLEAWIWQRNQRLATALKFGSVAEMVKAVHDAKVDWPNGQAKPSRPKEALEAVATRKRKIGYSSALHRAITTTISLAGCRDNAFLELRQTLQRWFPLEIQP
ncbi:MAG: methylation-associated defense system protein MAD4 [Candidatus Binataceae bacterium]